MSRRLKNGRTAMRGVAGAGAVVAFVGMFTFSWDLGTILGIGLLTILLGAPAAGGLVAVATPPWAGWKPRAAS